ncbi:hypothetical protein ACWPKO_17320 [Coraliomargarita sp. W4R53]
MYKCALYLLKRKINLSIMRFTDDKRNMSDDLNIPTLSLNLRWIARSFESNPDRWAEVLAKKVRHGVIENRMILLLMGVESKPADLDVFEDFLGYSREELQVAHLYEQDSPLIASNLAYLVGAIPRGQAKRLAAEKIGVRYEQLVRWGKWPSDKSPHPHNLRNLLKFHGIDPDLDLTKEPLFLSMEPISGYAQKKWVEMRVEEMSASEMATLYPALKRFFKSDEKR